MELLHVKEPKNNNKAVGDYLRADGPFEGKNTVLTSFKSFRERYGLQLYVERIFM
jgi:hypothetical protein